MTDESSPLAGPDLEPLTDGERRELLGIARDAVGEALGVAAPVVAPHAPALLAPGAAFVSIYVREHLRGCVGSVRSADPLYATVARVARAAALEDPRFPALDASEWREMKAEISRLGALRPARLEEIVPGLHGLSVARGDRRGLLLPQVAERFGWSRERLLEETCLKAGLARDAWRDAATEILAFTAEIFGDAGV